MRPYRTRAWPLGWQGIPWRPIFVSSHEKCLFYFQSAKIRFFCEAATETWNQKLGRTPHINNRPSRIHISALISLWHLRRYILNFVQASTNFTGTGLDLHFSGNKTSFWFFSKIIFGSVIHHFFTKLWSLRWDSATSGCEREFLCVLISLGSRIRRN
jgi:hypothetical protein